jgi:hypothetical protein
LVVEALLVFALALSATIAVIPHANGAAGDTDVPYGVGTWPESLGNQRARVRVDAVADAVRISIPWRRRDDAEHRAIVVESLKTGKPVRNVARIRISRESGEIAFQPDAGPGEYGIYFATVSITGWENIPAVAYPAPSDTAEPEWLERNGLPAGRRALPEASLLAIEARGEFQRRDPMELPATAAETRKLLADRPGEPCLLFPEDREHSIRMPDAIPLRWARRGPSSIFAASARRNEFLAFQIGLYAARAAVADLKVAFTSLRSPSGASIPASALRCFNMGGTDWLGSKLRKAVSVPMGRVQPLWFGVDVPESAAPGLYTGSITLRPADAPPQRVRLRLTVLRAVAPDHGDDDIRSMARLRWLDSTIGLDDEVTHPFTPVRAERDTLHCLGRAVRLGRDALPQSIVSWGHELLAHPVRLVLDTPSGPLPLTPGRSRTSQPGPGAVERRTTLSAGKASVRMDMRFEFDGCLRCRATVHALEDLALRDIRLEIPMRREMAAYLMGMGKEGGYRPPELRWKWRIDRNDNMVWVGTPDAGIQLKLSGPESAWALYSLKDSGLPQAWANDGRGGCDVVEEGPDVVAVRAYSGERTLAAGRELTFNFRFLITPFKPLDAAHWGWRYFHFGTQVHSVEEIAATGAKIINIHQGNSLNPYINYPFRNVDRLAPYVREAHSRGLKAKIYYTVRELSNYCREIWALRSLGFEVLADGAGGGDPWLQEHLVSHYGAAWRQPLNGQETDAAIATTGLSRWHNYYLEGLAWLIRNVGIDGLYLDGIGYDRRIMQRVRKVMDRARPGCLIDFHSGNNFHPEYGLASPANQYMEHLPYIDSVWFGEGYDPNRSSDYWLIEMSGIPFGLYGEMLHEGGNPWRGMLYGMTQRLGWSGDPRPIWKVWDDFGIAAATPKFYFQHDCPIRTNRDDIHATAYVRQGRTLIALASWAKETVRVKLAIDWKALGLDPAAARLNAPDVPGFQHAAEFAPGMDIPVEPGRGWLLIAH